MLLIGTNDLGAAFWDAADVRTAEEAIMRAVPGVTLRLVGALCAVVHWADLFMHATPQCCCCRSLPVTAV